MKNLIEVQIQAPLNPNITQTLLEEWVNATLTSQSKTGSVTICFVDKLTIEKLNSQYRSQHKYTNVLSFPNPAPLWLQEDDHLGDVICCAEVIEEEACVQHKAVLAHYAHMICHSVLHLLGFDHIDDHEAMIMESIEISILSQLGFSNPYEAVLK